ncbi:MAG: ABC transporter permease [Deltaproteobacteria bacterium HGW-Deltaproteobacteria-15]|jgi:ABC-2 type transport system permease protein|nr:MAG: ABC transporter permease [Deltaproteobacteria bacterium HGW-Deltaproteobacteria-15]
MRGMLAVLRKELTIFVSSPIFYAALFIFLLLTGYFFYSTVVGYSLISLQASSNPYLVERLNISDMFLKPFFADIAIILLLMLPLISMRTYAEEKKTGTIELLFTYPISDAAVLAGKFAAAVIILIIMLAGTVPSLLLLASIAKLEWGLVLSGYLGLMLMGASFLALGVFASSITENQIVAAVISFGLLLLFWVLGWGSRLAGPLMQEVIKQISVVDHLESFVEGLVDTRDLIFYLLFSFFWLFLTLRFLHSRFWRG